MERGKSRTSAELEAELRKELAENLIYYFFFVVCGMLLFFSVVSLLENYRLYRIIPPKIVVVVSMPFFIWCIGAVCSLMLNLHTLHSLSLGQRDQVLKWFRWEIVAALLLFQPRAYALMKGLLRRVEVEEEQDSAV